MPTTLTAFLDEIENPRWQEKGLCLKNDPGIFFSRGNAAKKICARCPVKDECLDWILDIESTQGLQFGTYGGMSSGARSKIRRCRFKNCKKEQLKNMWFCSEFHQKQNEKILTETLNHKNQGTSYYRYPYQGKVHHA